MSFSAAAKRLFFLDNLKAFIVCLMIIFHGAMAYMAYGPAGWYVSDPAEPQMSLTIFIIWADAFIVPIMFFVAGYFAINSLSVHSSGEFWKSKLVRIFIPWVLGVLLLAPLITYSTFVSRDIAIPYMEFWGRMFFFGPIFSHVHYWFLGTLFYLYVILFVAVKFKSSLKERLTPVVPGRLQFGITAVLSYCLTAGVCLLTGGYVDSWYTVWPVFVFQPTRLTFYIIYFFLGVYAWKRQWFSAKNQGLDSTIWLPAFVVFSVVYVAYSLFGATIVRSQTSFLLVKMALQSLYTMTAVFGLLAIFRSRMNYTNAFLTALSSGSYAMYYVHLGIVILLNMWLLQMAWPTYLKFAIVGGGGLIISYIVGRIFMLLPFFSPGKR
ncbi:MAG: acyltransferase family protein [Anaerovibrio sp.]|uniref:acyltransferase family protein n=1 Tax=Anaerovibrio sp. TaxID=1872532 RepID=UPI0025D996B3|nr:acyltransferase family protein [Anaerovibrio sp.]MCR5175261.1 acyltransferase family protein [Anaerovibrio sp.]